MDMERTYNIMKVMLKKKY